MLTLQSTLTFGKYRGKLLSIIIQIDLNYAQWLMNKCKGIVLSSQARDAIRLQAWLAQ